MLSASIFSHRLEGFSGESNYMNYGYEASRRKRFWADVRKQIEFNRLAERTRKTENQDGDEFDRYYDDLPRWQDDMEQYPIRCKCGSLEINPATLVCDVCRENIGEL